MKRRLMSALAAATLAGCTQTPPPAVPAPPPPNPQATARADVHDAARRRATELEGADHLRDAVFWLKVAQAASPAPLVEKAELERLERRIGSRVAADLKEGEAHRLAGDMARASASYEMVLRLDPANASAHRALRQLDRADKLKAIEQGGGGGPRTASED